MKTPAAIISAVTLLLGACTWVPLTPEGQKVRVLEPGDVATCKLKGTTTVALKAKVAGIERSQEKVKLELETLARNAAPDLEGDTVVADSDVADGKQSYKVYKCVDPEN